MSAYMVFNLIRNTEEKETSEAIKKILASGIILGLNVIFQIIMLTFSFPFVNFEVPELPDSLTDDSLTDGLTDLFGQ